MSRRGGIGLVVPLVGATLAAAGLALALTPPGDPTAGGKVFATAGCAWCHTLAAAKATGKVGPNLDALKPPAERVQAQVLSGGGAMPPFRDTLSAQQIADVAEFVAQSSRGWRPAAAGSAPGKSPPADPTQDSVVRVRLREWRIASTRRSLPAGPVTFGVTNAGLRPHSFVVLRLTRPAATLPKSAGRVREAGRVGGIVVPRGARRTLTVTLSPGSHVLISNRPGDVARGMALRVNVVDPAAPPREPVSAPDGKALFLGLCGGCHTLADAGTTGAVGPNLDRRGRSADRVARQVRDGEEDGSMPAFAGALADAQIQAIADYVSRVASR